MEKTPSACAMQWNIELEKGLRSKKPGKSIEAILVIGPRLEWWSRESNLHAAEYKIFGLIPGEDKLFANAILLRLADAFMSGDKHMKICIVKIFLSELKQRRQLRSQGRKDEGILSKDKVDSYRELLTRIKIVFDSGNVEERALALVLFGCWAHIAKDSADVRYLILSSLWSMHILEAKASLFAAGCFSELADDFAYVFLEMLGGLLVSSETSRAIRLAGGRAFAKMWCPILLADIAHKTGVKLILESSEEEFSLVMLVSLSKIASKWTPLIPRQILPPNLDTIPCTEILTIFSKFLQIVEFKLQSPVISERVFAIHVLVCIFDKLLGILKDAAGGIGSIVSSRMLTFTLDRISQLIKLVVDNPHPDKGTEQEVKSLLFILVDLVERHQNLSGIVLDKICIVIEHLVGMLNEITSMTNSVSEDHHITELDKENHTSTASRVLIYLSQILITCFEKLDVSTGGATQVFNRMEHLVEHVHQCSLLPVYIHLIYDLLLHFHAAYQCMWLEIGEDLGSNRNFRPSRYSSLSHDGSLSQHEILIIDRVKQILVKKDYWLSYKLAKYAACNGAWLVAAYIFGELIPMVQSDICCFWLKSLSHLSELERTVQLFGLTLSGNAAGEIMTADHIENVIGAANKLCSLEEAFDASVSGLAFSFQRWFITLRSKVVGTVADVLKLLSMNLLSQDATRSTEQIEARILVQHSNSSKGLSSLLQLLAHASSQFMRLVKEFDLLATSFIVMDRKSMKIVSDLGLSCSLLAFSTGLTLRFASFHGKQYCSTYGLETTDEQFHTQLVHDLLRRLGFTDLETSKNLRHLLDFHRSSRSCSMQEFRNEVSTTCVEARDVAKLCKYSVQRFLSLQAIHVHENNGISRIPRDALQLLFNIIFSWIQIPFRTPKHFFQLRPPISAELFITNEDGKRIDYISVLSGFQLPLTLCIQLRNILPDQLSQVSKLYCILHSRISFQVFSANKDKKVSESSCQAWKSDHMVGLNDKLLHFTTGTTERDGLHAMENAGGTSAVDKFVCFDPNEKGQGFATCLLDVSAFPVGSYQIKWHSCCIDNNGAYWSLMPLNTNQFFTVQGSSNSGQSVRVP
uniref:EMB1895 n=1 Tax=Solanum tuberosum TaxID=4113 RepID=M0ZUT5_SOLTU